MFKITPLRRLIAGSTIWWLEWELRSVEHDINATSEEIADYEFCGQPATAAGLRTYLRQRTAEAAGLRNRIHQLKENLQ